MLKNKQEQLKSFLFLDDYKRLLDDYKKLRQEVNKGPKASDKDFTVQEEKENRLKDLENQIDFIRENLVDELLRKYNKNYNKLYQRREKLQRKEDEGPNPNNAKFDSEHRDRQYEKVVKDLEATEDEINKIRDGLVDELLAKNNKGYGELLKKRLELERKVDYGPNPKNAKTDPEHLDHQYIMNSKELEDVIKEMNNLRKDAIDDLLLSQKDIKIEKKKFKPETKQEILQIVQKTKNAIKEKRKELEIEGKNQLNIIKEEKEALPEEKKEAEEIYDSSQKKIEKIAEDSIQKVEAVYNRSGGKILSKEEAGEFAKSVAKEKKIKGGDTSELFDDLELRKKEIYQEGDEYVEEGVGSGQFEYRKTPESEKKEVSLDERGDLKSSDSELGDGGTKIKIETPPVSIDKKVLEKAEQFGLSEEDLRKIEGFGELSKGQQLLVMRNLEQLTLGRIQEEAAKQYKQDTAKAKFLGRIWKRISRTYQIAKLEKRKAEEIVQGGLEVHKDILEELVDGMKNFGPEVEVRNGDLEIQYASNLENLNPKEKAKVEEFNKIATEFSKMPYEWSLPTATRKERRRYQELEKQYEKIKDNLLNIVTEKMGERDGCLYLNDVEYQIKINQFLNTNPEVEDALSKIKDRKVWLRAFANIATERGIYAGAGYVTRTVTVSMLGAIGAPIGAAVIGGWRARERAKTTLTEGDKAARRGDESGNILKKKYSEVKRVSDKVTLLVKKLQDENLSEKKRQAYKKSLKLSVEWIEDKMDKGLINFGAEKSRIARQYRLLQTLSQGRAQIEGYQIADKFKERFEKAIMERDTVAKKRRSRYLTKKMLTGAGISAGFSAAGYAIRYAGEELGWWGKPAAEVGRGVKETQFDSEVMRALDNLPDEQKEYIAQHGLDAAVEKYNLDTLKDLLKQQEKLSGHITGGGRHLTGGGGHSAAVKGPKDILGGKEPLNPPPTSPAEEEEILKESYERIFGPTTGAKAAEKLQHFEYQGGKSVWEEGAKQLKVHFKEFFNELKSEDPKLAEALETHNFDRLKDVIVAHPEKYGLPKDTDFVHLTTDDLKHIKWGEAFKDAGIKNESDLTRVLKWDDIESITKNNEKLREFFSTHRGVPGTNENYEAALHGREPAAGGGTGEHITDLTGNQEVPVTQKDLHGLGYETPEEILAKREETFENEILSHYQPEAGRGTGRLEEVMEIKKEILHDPLFEEKVEFWKEHLKDTDIDNFKEIFRAADSAEKLDFINTHLEFLRHPEAAENIFKIAEANPFSDLSLEKIYRYYDMVRDIGSPEAQRGLIELFYDPNSRQGVELLFKDSGINLAYDDVIERVVPRPAADGEGIVLHYDMKGPWNDFDVVIKGNGRVFVDGPAGWNAKFNLHEHNLKDILQAPKKILAEMQKAGEGSDNEFGVEVEGGGISNSGGTKSWGGKNSRAEIEMRKFWAKE